MLIQSLPLKIPKHLLEPPGKELASDGESLSDEENKVYISVIGKLLFIMKCSRPDILHTARELSRIMKDGDTNHHVKVLQETMNYVMYTHKIGLCLASKMCISHPKTQSFIIKGRSDINYVTNTETRKSTSGTEVTLNGAPAVMRSV